METNFIQVVEMTDEEKFKMYMKCKKADIVRMHIELERRNSPAPKQYSTFATMITTAGKPINMQH